MTSELSGKRQMRALSSLTYALVGLIFSFAAVAQESGTARPSLLHRELVTGMPRGEQQEVRVITATFKAGDKTVFHTHRFPVTVYVLQGTFTLELEGREPATVKAGEAMVEPPGVRMTGINRSKSETLKVVVFYVSDPGTPFLDLVH